jgi:serine/threonine protein kinase
MGSKSRNVRRRSLQKRKKRITIRNRRVSRRKNTRNRRVSRRKGKRSSRRTKRTSRRRSSVIRRSIKTPMAPRKGKKMIGGGWIPEYASYGIQVKMLGQGAYGEVFQVLPPASLGAELRLPGVELPSGNKTYVELEAEIKDLRPSQKARRARVAGATVDEIDDADDAEDVGSAYDGLLHKYEGKTYVLKVIPKLFSNVDDVFRVLREATVLKSLSNHPNLPTLLLKPNISGDKMFLAMEKCDMDLKYFNRNVHRMKEITDAPGFAFRVLNPIAIGILAGLEYLHHNYIIHRDIKPENIGINLNPTKAILLDFGLATIITDSDRLDNDLLLDLSEDEHRISKEGKGVLDPKMTRNMYTRWYRPPEVCMIYTKELPTYKQKVGNPPDQLKMYDYKADMWATGCCIVELFMGGEALLPSESSMDQLNECIKLSLTLEGLDGVKYLMNDEKSIESLLGTQLHQELATHSIQTVEDLFLLAESNVDEIVTDLLLGKGLELKFRELHKLVLESGPGSTVEVGVSDSAKFKQHVESLGSGGIISAAKEESVNSPILHFIKKDRIAKKLFKDKSGEVFPWCLEFLEEYAVPFLKFNPEERKSAAEFLVGKGIVRDKQWLTPPDEQFKTAMLQMCYPHTVGASLYINEETLDVQMITDWFNTTLESIEPIDPDSQTPMGGGKPDASAAEPASDEPATDDEDDDHDSFVEGVVIDFPPDIPLFDHLNESEMSDLVERVKREVFGPGDPIIAKDKIEDKFYIVEGGECLVVGGDNDGKMYGRGEFFGEKSMVENQPQGESVHAGGGDGAYCLAIDRTTYELFRKK